ncbi:MAG: hypothetical protein ABSD92_03355 [Candidatus Bathyarchaeia archaeon]|jgi:hypothetical protein
MKLKEPAVLLVLLLVLPLFLNCSLTTETAAAQSSPSLYFGVDVGFGGIAATEQLIDNISSYTNFFVIGCTNNYNETALNIISEYVYNKGLTFIVYSDFSRYPSQQWLADAKKNFGNSFLGIYYFDEPGGKQIDQTDYPIIPALNVNLNKTTYSDVSNWYVGNLSYWLRGQYSITKNFADPTEYQLFTSDYGLYWYDYEAGYNTVFAEFTMNYSQQFNVALCRGAATVQSKDWGVMITWKYTQSPYMENGSELLSDMELAYENGAKYIIVFDSNANYTQNVLTQNIVNGQGGQLAAMYQFWQYVKANPRTITTASERTAYVLPAAYGYGFRGPLDRIWGLWLSDNDTTDIGMSITSLIQMLGNNLDIVYPDGSRSVESVGYNNVINWNDPNLIPTPSPTPQQTTSSPFHATSVYFYAIVACLLVLVAVAALVLKFRKRSG